MRVLIVGDATEAGAVEAALRDADVPVERRGDDPPPADGSEEIAEIARDLREFEGLLGGSQGAVLVASDSPAALAAVVVATKLGAPVGLLEPSAESANARVIRQLAGTTLAPDPAAVVDWVRAGYPARE